jgi:hypothetical protein
MLVGRMQVDVIKSSSRVWIPELKSDFYTPCMRKLDRLPWTHGCCYTAFGCDVGLRANSAEALEEISQHVPHWIKPSATRKVDRVVSFIKGGRKGSRRFFNLLYLDHALAARSLDIAAVKEHLIDGIEIAFAEKAKSHIVLHAGAVSWGGKGILIPGRSHSGKSTLVAELLKQGATYYSDEFAAINRHGEVEPLDRPLHLRGPELKSQNIITAAQLGARSASTPISIRLVVFAEYQENSEFQTSQTLSAGQSTLSLMESCFTARSRPEDALTYLENVARGAKVIRSNRGEAKLAAREILQFVEESSVH